MKRRMSYQHWKTRSVSQARGFDLPSGAIVLWIHGALGRTRTNNRVQLIGTVRIST